MAAALLALTLVAALPVVPPQAVPADVSDSTFSAERAMQDLEMVAAVPHPTGSAAQQRVREYLVAQAEGLGLPTEVQQDAGSGAENVIVRMAGRANSAHDVLITAHYDSVPSAPGAADNGMAVAAMLETMRVLQAQEPLANDIVFLFTDGEERGLKGIAAFVHEHPAADRIAVAFAFEGLPESSGTVMRNTTPGDAWLVGQLAEASVPVFANSATNSSDRQHLGNDFAMFAPVGIVAAEFLTEGDVVRYHNAGDNVAAIDAGVVQDHGDTMVALARHFGDLDLSLVRPADHDLVFFTAPVMDLVTYPVWLAQALALTAAVALGVIVAAALRRKRLRGAHLMWATFLIPGMVFAGTALTWGAWQALLALNPESAQTLHYPDFERSTTAMVVIYAVIGIAFVAACHLLSGRIGALELTAGTLAWWMLLALLLAFGEPLFSSVALWPLVGGVTALAVISLVRRPWPKVAMLALAAVPGLVLLVPILILEALNVEQGPLVAVPILLLLLGSLLPQLLLISGRLMPHPVEQKVTREPTRPVR
ncbi:MAG TPA: M20/M25/M40 family metallo-hydrolase [Jiangellaceae bacterium]|nr:M20/M25/M40 family metallo-hydrolase [Jiangellaceae bacterium]